MVSNRGLLAIRQSAKISPPYSSSLPLVALGVVAHLILHVEIVPLLMTPATYVANGIGNKFGGHLLPIPCFKLISDPRD